MLRKPITYRNFMTGEDVTEEFYFNLTKAELIEMELGHGGQTFSDALKRIVASKDGAKIMEEFKNIILKAYGVRTEDGRRFIKNQQLRDEFEATEAYSNLFVELVTDAGAAAEFVSGIMPQDLMSAAQLQMEMEPPSEKPFVDEDGGLSPLTAPEVAVPRPLEARKITAEDAAAMDAAQLQAGILSGAIEIVPRNPLEG